MRVRERVPMLLYVHITHQAYQDGHLNLHTAPELCEREKEREREGGREREREREGGREREREMWTAVFVSHSTRQCYT